MNKLFATAVTTAFLVFGSAFAQQRPATASSSEDEKSVSGCLMKGTQDNMYILTQKDSGNKWYAMSKTASVDLSKHVNHEVKLTGKEIARSAFYSGLGKSVAQAAASQAGQSTQKPGSSSSTQSSTSKPSTAGAEKYLQVTDVDHIAATCESK